MSIIQDHAYLTLINTFSVKPENQQGLIDLLQTATEDVMRNLPGFISANIHRSLDGKKVVNYAQWRSLDYFESMKQNPLAQKHMKEVEKMCEKFESVMTEVESTHEGDHMDPPPMPGFLERFENNSPI